MAEMSQLDVRNWLAHVICHDVRVFNPQAWELAVTYKYLHNLFIEWFYLERCANFVPDLKLNYQSNCSMEE